MADPKTQELQTQADLQAQINKVLESRNAILAAQQKALSTQVQLAVDMCKALKCEELDKVEERLKTTRDAMTAAATEAGKLKNGLDGVAGAGQNAGRQGSSALEELNKKATTSNLTIAGFGAGVLQFGGIFMQTFKNVISMAGGLLESLGRLGFAIFTLPFKLLGGLFDLAQGSGGGGPSPTAQALEKIRGELGGLNTAVGKAAASSLPQFRKQLMNLAGTGLSVRKVFGPGREGLAKAMEYNLELFKALGPAAESFAGVLQKNAVELAMYRKGLGISAESQAQILKLAEASGKNPTAAMHDFATMAINMGESFGISAAVIGKDMAEMKADFANFGTLSTRELGQAAVYAHKLGIAIKDLQGLIGAFDDFESAAQNAAKLSQAFGMNVDAMKMLNAQNPAERLSMLQKAFRETGKSVDSMSRQELKLLAAQSGLSEEAASLAFSQKGLSMSYDQVQKAGAKAEKKQLTQAEAMAKLADSIERVFGSGGGSKFQGFFDAFSKGFQSGILRSKELRGLFRDIRRSLKTVYWAGRSVGKMFAEMFPGFQQMVRGLRDVFNPTRFRDMMGKVKDIFKQFFLDLRTDPKAGVEKFVERMKEAFKSLFEGQGSGINTFMEGGKKFLKTIGAIFMAILPMVLDGLVNAVNAIANFLENPPGLPSAVSELGSQLLDALIRVFDVLKDRLWPPIKRMFSALWEKIGPYVEEIAWRVFQVSLFKAFIRGVAGGLGGAAIAFLKDRLLSIFKSVPTPPPPAPAGGATNPAAATSMVPTLVAFMAAIGVLLLAFAAVVLIYKVANLKPEDALAIGAVVVALSASAALMSIALKAVSGLNPTESAKNMGIIAVFMLAAGVVGALVTGMLAAMPTPDPGQVLAFTSVMLNLVMASIPMIIAAAVIGAMGAAASTAVEGMVILGGFMLALGVVAAIITGLLSLVSNPAGIGTLMEGISSIMFATLAMLPAALALGLMAAAAPFGPAGVILMIVGFEAIALLAGALVTTLMPVISRLASIKIEDPESFKTVMKGMLDIMSAVNEFIKLSARLGEVMRPSLAQIFDPNAFENNINAMSEMIDTIINSGVMRIMDSVMEFAQRRNISEHAGAVISGIAGVIAGVAQLMGAFMPNGEVLKAIAETAAPGVVEMLTLGPFAAMSAMARTNMLLEAMKQFQETTMQSLTNILPAIVGGITDLLNAVGTVPANIKDVGPFISAFSSVLTAVTDIMKAMSPSDAAYKVAEAGADVFDGEDAEALLKQAFDGMSEISESIPDLIRRIGPPIQNLMSGLLTSLQPILTAARGMDPQVIGAVAQIFSGVVDAVGSLVGMIQPMINAASQQAESAAEGVDKSTVFSSALTNMTTMFTNLGPAMLALVQPLQTMVTAVLNIAKGITNSRGLKSKVEAVTAALAAVGQISQIFGPDGPFYGEPAPNSTGPINLISDIVMTMSSVATRILTRGGPLQQVINAFDNVEVKNARSLKSKAEALTAVFAGIQALSSAMQTMNATGTVGLGEMASTFNNRLGNVGTVTHALENMVEILNVVPRNIANVSSRVTAMVQAYTALHTALSTPLGDANIAAIVRLNDSLDGQRNLTVRHESLPPINLTVTVHVDSERVGEAILNNERDIATSSGRRFAITGPNPA